MPISSTVSETTGSTGNSWLISATIPSVAPTPVIASSTGIPAATSAPNASTRIVSVIGSDSVRDLAKSSLKLWLSA